MYIVSIFKKDKVLYKDHADLMRNAQLAWERVGYP